MAKLSKRRRAINEKVEEGKLYSVAEAFGLLKELSAVKFNETVDVAINLVLTRVSLTRSFVVLLPCPMAQAKMFVSVYLLRVTQLMQRKLQVLSWLVWTN